jgi:hypothetical protein
VREGNQVLGAALLDPSSGFVAPGEVPPHPRQQAASQARERVSQVRQQWEARRDAAARQALAQRYPPEVVERLFRPTFLTLALSSSNLNLDGATPRYFVDGQVMNLRAADLIATFDPETDPRAKAAIQELEAFRKRSEITLPRLLAEGRTEELAPALEHLVRRMFTSPRLRPVLEQRLGNR